MHPYQETRDHHSQFGGQPVSVNASECKRKGMPNCTKGQKRRVAR